jgi:hypothetical protein
VKRILSSQLIHAFRPDNIFNADVRYALSDLSATKIQLEGYVQTRKPIDVYILRSAPCFGYGPYGLVSCADGNGNDSLEL